MAGGGGSGGLGSMLPMALAIGATIATDGAAAPMLGEAMGAEAGTLGATMLGAGAMGAGTSALGGIMQGQSAGDVLKNSLISGTIGAGTAGILGGLSGGPTPNALVPSSSGTEMNAMVNPSLGNNGITLPPTLDASLSPYGFEPTPNTIPSLNSGLPTPNPSITTPFGTSGLGSGVSSGIPSAIPETVSAGPGSFFDKSYTPSIMAGSAIAAAPSVLGANMFAQPTLTGAQTEQPVPSGLQYTYDRNVYQPSVAPNYNGIAGLNTGPAAQRLIGYGYGNPKTQNLSGYGYADGGSIGTVEEMSRENATGGNQMFPQSGLGGLTGANTYQNATNTPTSSNLMEPTDAVTDPYTGAMKFAAGGPAPTAQNMLNTMSQSTANAMQNGNSSGFSPIGSASNLISGNTSGSGSQGIDFANDPNYVFDQRTGQYVRRFATGGQTKTSPTQKSADTQQGAYDLNTIKQYIQLAQTPIGLKQVTILADNGDDSATQAIYYLKNQPVTGPEQAGLGQTAQASMQPLAAQSPMQQAPVQAAHGGIMGYSRGGSQSLGSYSDGGQMLKGPGDGMSDSIPAKIGRHQPARLADGEFVVPADVVSHLGNGSTDAGAKHLYSMMDKVRTARTGRKTQGKQIKPEKYMPA